MQPNIKMISSLLSVDSDRKSLNHFNRFTAPNSSAAAGLGSEGRRGWGQFIFRHSSRGLESKKSEQCMGLRAEIKHVNVAAWEFFGFGIVNHNTNLRVVLESLDSDVLLLNTELSGLT